jgi:deazaflavin-dependent oxidoreductase (nitroreductase family)
MNLFMRIGNALTAALLRSPLHGLFSGGVMLITVTGRRTGRRYTTPVQYVRRNGSVFVTTRRNRTWWRNARAGAPVTLRIRGRTLTGVAEALVDDAERASQRHVFERTSLERAAMREDGVFVRVSLDAEEPQHREG